LTQLTRLELIGTGMSFVTMDAIRSTLKENFHLQKRNRWDTYTDIYF
jgi:hypothetical protein